MANTHSLDLEAGSSQYATAADSASLSLSATGTIELWANFESTPTTGNSMGLVVKDDEQAQRSYKFWITNDGGTLKLRALVLGTEGTDHYEWNWTPSTGTWYHLALTIDTGEASATTFELYINGVSQGNGSVIASDNIATIYDRTCVLTLGARNTNVGAYAGYFDGKLDEVRIWNDVRTGAEIDDNKGNELVGNEAGLVAYWKLNNDYTDSQTSGNNDLTASGSPVFSTNVPFSGTTTSTSSTTTSSSTSSTTTSSSTSSTTTSSSTSSTISTSTSSTTTSTSSTTTSTTTTLAYYVSKYYEYKVYENNVYKTNWTKEVTSIPNFRNVINGGPGEITVRLARSFDDFGENDDVKLNNRVDVWTYDRDYPDGQKLYRGFISGYRPILDEHKEFVEITILSYVFELGYYMLRDGSGDTKIAYNSQDPTDILKDVIDKYRVDGGSINYTATSIETTNTTVSYTFNSNTIREAADKIVELAPEGWYWTINADSIISFKQKSATATHDFTIGTDITHLETWRRIEDVINRVYFTGFTTVSGTGLYRVYSNTGSIDAYGLHALHKVDHRVTQTSTADTMSNRILNTKSTPEIRTNITVIDNNGTNPYRGYDIESVVPGDTMKIRGLKEAVKTYTYWGQSIWDTDVWDQTLTAAAADVIQVLAFDYGPDSIRIEASSRLPEIAKRIEDIERNLVDTQTVDNPATPTAG